MSLARSRTQRPIRRNLRGGESVSLTLASSLLTSVAKTLMIHDYALNTHSAEVCKSVRAASDAIAAILFKRARARM